MQFPDRSERHKTLSINKQRGHCCIKKTAHTSGSDLLTRFTKERAQGAPFENPRLQLLDCASKTTSSNPERRPSIAPKVTAPAEPDDPESFNAKRNSNDGDVRCDKLLFRRLNHATSEIEMVGRAPPKSANASCRQENTMICWSSATLFRAVNIFTMRVSSE